MKRHLGHGVAVELEAVSRAPHLFPDQEDRQHRSSALCHWREPPRRNAYGTRRQPHRPLQFQRLPALAQVSKPTSPFDRCLISLWRGLPECHATFLLLGSERFPRHRGPRTGPTKWDSWQRCGSCDSRKDSPTKRAPQCAPPRHGWVIPKEVDMGAEVRQLCVIAAPKGDPLVETGGSR